MKKVVVKLNMQDDDKDKRKAIKAVSTISGVDSIAVDMKEKKLTVIGDVDPVSVASKLRKLWRTEIVSVGPAKEEKKEEKKEEPKKEEVKEEPKKEEPKKEEAKKEEPKKEEPKKEEKKEDPKKEEEKKKEAETQIADLVNAYKAYNPHYTTHYFVRSVEENPNGCVIC